VRPAFWRRSEAFPCPRSSEASLPASLSVSAATPRRGNLRSGGCAADSRWVAVNCLREKISTTVPSFVDTNIIVYAEDRDAKRKHEIARDLVVQLWDERAGVLSMQVLQEFYVTVTRKLKKPLSNAKALEVVEEYLTWKVVENTGKLLTAAIELQQKAQLSFWDATVVQAAIDAGCDTLYSEDLNAGQRFGSLAIVNPFK
jgi:predicted nucleic acid-binding protein